MTPPWTCGVSLSEVMYRRYSADFADIDTNVHEHCPEVGVGQWAGERGAVVEGPTSLNGPRQEMLGDPAEVGGFGIRVIYANAPQVARQLRISQSYPWPLPPDRAAQRRVRWTRGSPFLQLRHLRALGLGPQNINGGDSHFRGYAFRVRYES